MRQVISRLIMILQSLLLQLLFLLFEIPQLLLLQNIGEFFPNELQFLLIKYIDMLVDVVIEPRVIQYLVCSGPLLRDFLEHHLHHLYGLLRHGVLILDILVELLYGVEVADLVCLEWHVAVEHCVEADAGAPYVYGEALVSHVLNNLWCYVGWCATLLEEDLLFFYLPANSEVANLDISMTIKQYIVKFDVAVSHLILMEVRYAFHDLFEDEFSILLTQFSPLPDVVQQIAARTQLHHDHVMLLGLEGLQNLYVVWVSQTLEYIYLIHYLLLLALFFHEIHINTFDGAQLAGQSVQAQINLSECTLPQHFANLVQLQLCLGRLFVLLEAVCDELAD